MTPDRIVDEIVKLENHLLSNNGGKVELAPAHILSETSVKMTVLLANLNDPIFQAELDYKLERSKMFHDKIKEGMKPSPAGDAVDAEPGMIRQKIEVEKLKSFVKRIDLLVSAMKAHIQVKTQESRNQGM